MKNRIYADNAATTKLDELAFESMKQYLLKDYSNPSQPYSFAKDAKLAIYNARVLIAKSINAEPEEIYFTSGGTESDNWAIKGICFNNDSRKSIVTSMFEHHAVLRSCNFVEKIGYTVKYVAPNSNGMITTNALKKQLKSTDKLVSIMLVNNEIGTIQPIKELCQIDHENGSLFHTDAVQAVGHLKIDVKDLGVDMLSSSAHKFNGPKGIGLLYIKKGTPIVSMNNGGSQENSMRAGTENVAAIVGMATALSNNINMDYSQHIKNVESRFLEKCSELGVKFCRNGNGPFAPGLINLSFQNYEGEALLHRLDLLGISVSTGSACDSVNTQISHVLKAIGLSRSKAVGTIRISFGKYNTLEKADIIAKELSLMVK